MSAFDKMEYELYAILSLQKAFWQFTENLIKGESPDWWNNIDDIGIEVVRAVTPHIGYTIEFSNRYLGKQKKSIPAKEISSFQGNAIFNKSGRLVAVSDTKGLFDGTRHIQLAITAARKKLSLLNGSTFRRFKRNCLYIYLTASLYDRDCEQFIREYKKCSSEFQYCYSDIFLMAFDCITWIDIATYTPKKLHFSSDDTEQLDKKVHEMRQSKDWMVGTPFYQA